MPTDFDDAPPVRVGGPPQHERQVLTMNGGSSSIKFALFESGSRPRRTLAGAVERIGLPDAFLRATPHERRPLPASDFDGAIAGMLDRLDEGGGLRRIAAVGHRIVHGGPARTDPGVVTPELLADLRDAMPLAPSHLPAEIRLIEALARRLPDVPQVVCFDTTFHRDLPPPARFLPIPRKYRDAGVRRYGFHGLSYAYLMGEFERLAGADASRGRVVLAHLGSGASMAAVKRGRCIDTTMGLTPTGGLVMGSRAGDLDPGVLVYLARNERMSADQLEDTMMRRSGMLGISETSADMHDLLERQATDERAAEAVEIFCYQARKWVGSLAASLGGIDTLIFSGGIGEHAPEVRARICDGLDFLGVQLDLAANAANAAVVSAGPVSVRVIPTDEESMIARTVFRLIEGELP